MREIPGFGVWLAIMTVMSTVMGGVLGCGPETPAVGTTGPRPAGTPPDAAASGDGAGSTRPPPVQPADASAERPPPVTADAGATATGGNAGRAGSGGAGSGGSGGVNSGTTGSGGGASAAGGGWTGAGGVRATGSGGGRSGGAPGNGGVATGGAGTMGSGGVRTGGAPGSGGARSGGAPGTGGTASGGAPGSGGARTGGAPGSGGASTGGAPGSGGASTGGAPGSGGARSGGAPGTGGTASGGATGSGGAALGGATGSGGAASGGAGGGAIGAAPLPGELGIVELLINPAGTDTGREWLELVNRSTHAVALDGLHLADAANDAPVEFAAGLALLPAGARAVLVQSGDVTKNGGISAATAAVVGTFGTLVSLNNEADTITLCAGACDAGGLVLAQASWDASLGTGYDGHALVIDDGGRRCPATAPFGDAGSFGTPGAANVACP